MGVTGCRFDGYLPAPVSIAGNLRKHYLHPGMEYNRVSSRILITEINVTANTLIQPFGIFCG